MPRPCRSCRGLEGDWRIDRINAPFIYCRPLSTYLKALKYRGRRELGPALGALLAAEVGIENLAVDLIVGVPLHPARLRARSFNQAHEIARALARGYRWPLATNVRRVIDTPPQTDLDRARRHRLAPSAFSVPDSLAGAQVAIIDDVITTGTTVNALAAALKAAGVLRVEAWAVARSIGEARDSAQPGPRT
ncbi:MAG: phosphoribosyltransferase family protein [Gammaproteobacteria bacterium]|jgi:ComF family protein